MAFHPIYRDTSIWSSVEMSAASKGFNYANYLNIHQMGKCPGMPLSEQNYSLICQILNNSIIEIP